MSVSSVLKATFALKCITQKSVAEAMDVTLPSLANKMARNSYTVGDLIRILNAIDCKLAVVDANNKVLNVFELEDAGEPRKAREDILNKKQN